MPLLLTELTIKGGLEIARTRELGEFYASLFDQEIKPEPVPFMAPVLLFSLDKFQHAIAPYVATSGQDILVQEYQSGEIDHPLETGMDLMVAVSLEQPNSNNNPVNFSIDFSTEKGMHIAGFQTILRKMSCETLETTKGTRLPGSARSGEVFWISTRPLSGEVVARYAQLSGDQNPIHIDEGYAHSIGLHGTVVPGMLLAGLIGSALSLSHPDTVLNQLRIRFTAPIPTGQTVRIGVQEKPRRNETDGEKLRIYFVAENENIAAIADVSVRPDITSL